MAICHFCNRSDGGGHLPPIDVLGAQGVLVEWDNPPGWDMVPRRRPEVMRAMLPDGSAINIKIASGHVWRCPSCRAKQGGVPPSLS